MRSRDGTAAPGHSSGGDGRSRAISVVIVDDDEAFRTALSAVLTSYGLHVAGTARDGREALALVPALAPDVVLMDLVLPGASGVEVTRDLATAAPDTEVLMLAMSGDQAEVIEAMIAGACGYVLKGTPPASLVADIRAAAEGDCVMSASVAAKLFGSFVARKDHREPVTLLSKRELEILKMIAGGKQNAEIAAALVLSPYTVRNHISNVLRKLQVENRTQAAGYAARHGLT